MNMTLDEAELLRQVLGGYFHQDSYLYGGTSREILVAIERDYGHEPHLLVSAARLIEALLALEHDDRSLAKRVHELGFDYRPMDVPGGTRGLLIMMVSSFRAAAGASGDEA